MMTWKGLTAAAAAIALGAAPVAAAPASTPLHPATEQVDGDTALRGANATVINIGILAALIVIVLVFVAKDSNNGGTDTPNSP